LTSFFAKSCCGSRSGGLRAKKHYKTKAFFDRDLQNVSHSKIFCKKDSKPSPQQDFHVEKDATFEEILLWLMVLAVLAQKSFCGSRSARLPLQNVGHSNIFAQILPER